MGFVMRTVVPQIHYAVRFVSGHDFSRPLGLINDWALGPDLPESEFFRSL
jgi:hypothetical protein